MNSQEQEQTRPSHLQAPPARACPRLPHLQAPPARACQLGAEML